MYIYFSMLQTEFCYANNDIEISSNSKERIFYVSTMYGVKTAVATNVLE